MECTQAGCARTPQSRAEIARGVKRSRPQPAPGQGFRIIPRNQARAASPSLACWHTPGNKRRAQVRHKSSGEYAPGLSGCHVIQQAMTGRAGACLSVCLSVSPYIVYICNSFFFLFLSLPKIPLSLPRLFTDGLLGLLHPVHFPALMR